MKKSIKLAAMFVAATTMMVACNSGDKEGFQKTENGLYYRFDKQNPKGQQVQEGDVLVGELTIRFDTTELFTNKGDARRIAQAIPNFEIKIGEGLLMMHVGDVATFAMDADTAAKYGDEQVLLWRRSFDVQPPALDLHDERSPRMDPRYNEIPDNLIPLTESLKDTIERLMPYYRGTILPAFENRNTLMVVAHGNSLRGIVKELKGMSNEEIIKFNLPTAVPYVFTFDDRMNLVEDKFLGDPEAIAAKMQSVANQAKRK
jgi:broad specificity phosphatase PhoE